MSSQMELQEVRSAPPRRWKRPRRARRGAYGDRARNFLLRGSLSAFVIVGQQARGRSTWFVRESRSWRQLRRKLHLLGCCGRSRDRLWNVHPFEWICTRGRTVGCRGGGRSIERLWHWRCTCCDLSSRQASTKGARQRVVRRGFAWWCGVRGTCRR